MRIVETIVVAKGQQRDCGGLELRSRGKRTFEGHQVCIVHNPKPPGVDPRIYLCPLHIPRNFADNGKPIAGACIGHKQARIF